MLVCCLMSVPESVAAASLESERSVRLASDELRVEWFVRATITDVLADAFHMHADVHACTRSVHQLHRVQLLQLHHPADTLRQTSAHTQPSRDRQRSGARLAARGEALLLIHLIHLIHLLQHGLPG